MRIVEEVRRLRLELLKVEFGSYAEITAKMGRNRRDSTLTQIANGSANSKGGKPKTMGSPIARSLEAACNKPAGWMDTDPDLWPFALLDLERIRGLTKPERDNIEGAILILLEQLAAFQKRDAA